jgi:uncharacterized BrkB/YihY/UPF0761 family membrane protein
VMKSPRQRRILTRQLLYLLLTAFAMVLFFAASYIRFAVIILFQQAHIPASFIGLGTKVLSMLLLWFGFMVIYRMCYHGTIHLPMLLFASFIVAAAWQLVNYLGMSIISYTGKNEVVYGFLAVVVVFLAWAYLFAIFLFIGGIIIARHSQSYAAKKTGAFYVFR